MCEKSIEGVKLKKNNTGGLQVILFVQKLNLIKPHNL